MALLLKKAWEAYKFLFEDLVDPKTSSWFLVGKPYLGLTMLGLYLMFVLRWGPEWMKNRRPFNLDKLLIVYNIIQVILCAIIFYGALVNAWAWDYKWFCEPVDYSVNEKSITVAKYVYGYFLLKVLDLLDTVFFVLRKKFNQVSFLHVYHHTGMVALSWGASTYFPGGHATLIGVINSFVHIVMYSYYLLTVVMPSAKKSLWWKKYITQLQIFQFFWCVVHMAVIVFMPECEYPRWISAIFLPQNLFMLILFTDFYIKTYIKRSPNLQASTTTSAQKNSIENNGSLENGIKKHN